MFDVVIIGAGFAGSVLARQLAEQKGKNVLIVEKRRHIGGNCYDYVDGYGVLVHKYGPHLFHTSNEEVYHYLGRFTSWHEYQHHVLASVDGGLIPLPFNLNSLAKVFPRTMADSLERKLLENFGFGTKVPILDLMETSDTELKELAAYIYEKIFLNYTVKQWGCTPQEISAEVTKRVPVSVSRDDRYFQDVFQAVPRLGYTRMFESMLDHENIHILLNTDYNDIARFTPDTGNLTLFGQNFSGDCIFTGMIDEFFEYRFGRLPYRSLKFEFESIEKEVHQHAAVVNYPNNYDFTRVTEFKHIHPRTLRYTTLLREYPRDYGSSTTECDTPSYPVFKDENAERYHQYQLLAEQYENITFVGRLAEYRYYDMDDIVARALELYSERFA